MTVGHNQKWWFALHIQHSADMGIRCMAVLSNWWSDLSESSGVGQRWHGLSWANIIFVSCFFVDRKRWRNTTWCQTLEVQWISTPNSKFIRDFGIPPFSQRRRALGGGRKEPSWLASVKVSPFARSCSKDWGNKLQDALSKASKYISSPENRGAESRWKWNSGIYNIICT